MSLDLSFWKYKADVPHDDGKVYETVCCDGGTIEELEPLPIEEILEKVASAFSGWTVQDSGRDFEKEGRGAFQIFTTPQAVRFDCYGMRERDLNRLIDVLAAFSCPLYDPQTGTRFDSWTDR